MSDLISRQAVINSIANTCFWLSASDWNELIECINSIPLVENKGEWIPISSIDEIPKKGAYWVTFEYENGYRETSHIGWDTFHEHWDDEEGWALDNEKYVIAYMPYFEPKPYNPNGK